MTAVAFADEDDDDDDEEEPDGQGSSNSFQLVASAGFELSLTKEILPAL